MILPTVAIGAIAAAIIGGFLTLTSLIGGKENKTSEFRQAWIDALRIETAKFISHSIVLDGMVGTKFPTRADIWKNARADSLGITQCASNIRMRLNPEEVPSKKILVLIDEIERLLGFDDDVPSRKIPAPPKGAVAEKNRRLANAVNEVLKTDWKRVKKGEPRYRAVVWIAAGILVSGFAALLYTSFEGISPQQVEKPLSKKVTGPDR